MTQEHPVEECSSRDGEERIQVANQLKKASTRQNKVEGFLAVIFAPLWSKRIKKR